MLTRVAPPVLALLLLVAAWEVLVRVLDIPIFQLPPPSAVVTAALGSLGAILSASFVTARAALAGFLLSAVLGILVAVALSSSRLLERTLYPYTVFLQTVPIVAVAPLLVTWFGSGFGAVAVAA